MDVGEDERIEVVGNTRTRDYVIRRELLLSEGDAYNRVLVDRSKMQVRALGFFKDVDITQVPGDAPDKTNLQVKVTEQPTGELSFSAGYSSVDRLVTDIGISDTRAMVHLWMGTRRTAVAAKSR